MKRAVKIALAVVAAAAAVAGYAFYAAMPADVETVRVVAADASEYFIEEGNVKAQTTVEVYSPVSGKIIGRAAEEGGMIEAGGAICTLDPAEFENAIARARASIEGYEALKADLGEQRRARASELGASLASLRSELENVTAQENDYLAQAADAAKTANDATAAANDAIAANDALIAASLAAQQIVIGQAQAALEQAERDAADAEALLGSGAMSSKDYDAVMLSRRNAEAALESAMAQLDVIRSSKLEPSALQGAKAYTEQYESMKHSLAERIAVVEGQMSEDYSAAMRQYYDAMAAGELAQIEALEKSVADCAVTSPVSGKITDLYIKDSNIVSAASPVALVETGRSSDIEVYVSAKDFAGVGLGDAVEVTQPAASGDIVFGGVVKEIGAEAVERMSALGISERAVLVTVEPEEGAGASFLPGFPFDVKFFTFAAENQLTVPKTAVFKYSAEKAADGVEWLEGDLSGEPVSDIDMVYAVDGGVVRMRQVRLGRELRSDYIVEAGLQAGDIVVKDSSDDDAKVGAKVNA